jgi:hypothetical protein
MIRPNTTSAMHYASPLERIINNRMAQRQGKPIPVAKGGFGQAIILWISLRSRKMVSPISFGLRAMGSRV